MVDVQLLLVAFSVFQCSGSQHGSSLEWSVVEQVVLEQVGP